VKVATVITVAYPFEVIVICCCLICYDCIELALVADGTLERSAFVYAA
jgi:hypothetical protein